MWKGAFRREKGRTSWEDWVRRVEKRFDERQRPEGIDEFGRREVGQRQERREGKGEGHEEVRQVKGEIGKGKGVRKGKRLGEEAKGIEGRFLGREGKGQGGFDEQRWWDDWWAMKEWSGDDLDLGQKLRNVTVRMAERLGEEMASELRMAECRGEEFRSEFKRMTGQKGGLEIRERKRSERRDGWIRRVGERG